MVLEEKSKGGFWACFLKTGGDGSLLWAMEGTEDMKGSRLGRAGLRRARFTAKVCVRSLRTVL